jgi:hypothetical protein
LARLESAVAGRRPQLHAPLLLLLLGEEALS